MKNIRPLLFWIRFFLALAVVLIWGASMQLENSAAPTITPSPVSTPTATASPSATASSSTQQIMGVATRAAEPDWQRVRVTRVVDGDTIEIEGGKKVRYIGVDTPETVDPRQSAQCFGTEASAFNRQLVDGQLVWLETDVSQTDRYGRLLRYVYIADSSISAEQPLVMVNAKLVAEGFARASSYPPDVAHRELFAKLEAEARESERGLWKMGICEK